MLATNFGHSGRGYAQGDFNYDGVVNTADFTLLTSKFGGSLPHIPAPAALLETGELFSTATITPGDGLVRDILPA